MLKQQMYDWFNKILDKNLDVADHQKLPTVNYVQFRSLQFIK